MMAYLAAVKLAVDMTMSCLSLRGCLRDDWHELSRSLFGLVKSSTRFVGTQNLKVFFRSLKKGIAVQSDLEFSCGNSLSILFIVNTFLDLVNRSFDTQCLALSSCGATPSCLIMRTRKSTCLTPKWHVDIVSFRPPIRMHWKTVPIFAHSVLCRSAVLS